jgi:hypothetical protein
MRKKQMSKSVVSITPVGGDLYLIEPMSRPPDPGFGRPGFGGVDPGYGHPGGGWDPTDPGYGHPGGGHRPGHGLPIPPVKPETPIVLPPGVWPPRLPPGAEIPVDPSYGRPGFIPPDPDYGIELPITLPVLPPGVVILIALPTATPKADAPPGTVPAILLKSGQKPILVYVTAAPAPK